MCECGYALYATRADVVDINKQNTCLQVQKVNNDTDDDVIIPETRNVTSLRKQKVQRMLNKDENSKQNVDNALQELLQKDVYKHYAENGKQFAEKRQKSVEICDVSVENARKLVESQTQNVNSKTLVVKPMTSAGVKSIFRK